MVDSLMHDVTVRILTGFTVRAVRFHGRYWLGVVEITDQVVEELS